MFYLVQVSTCKTFCLQREKYWTTCFLNSSDLIFCVVIIYLIVTVLFMDLLSIWKESKLYITPLNLLELYLEPKRQFIKKKKNPKMKHQPKFFYSNHFRKSYSFESRDVCLVLVGAHHPIINLMCLKKPFKKSLFGTIASRGVKVVNFHWWGSSPFFRWHQRSSYARGPVRHVCLQDGLCTWQYEESCWMSFVLFLYNQWLDGGHQLGSAVCK